MSGLPFSIEHFHYPGLFTLLILGGIGFPFPEDNLFQPLSLYIQDY